MKYQAILFDLDGTLLHMREKEFVSTLISSLITELREDAKSYSILGDELKNSLQYVIKNDGSCTNRQAFINYYTHLESTTDLHIDIDSVERFYQTKFDSLLRHTCGKDPEAVKLISYIQALKIPMIVATNPFFPKAATYTRLHWAGLDPADFQEITTYENYHYCKPNIFYYEELFDKTGINPHQCLMVGNNVDEDMIVQKLGCDVFLVLRDLINVNNVDISQYKRGSLGDVIKYLENKK